MVLGTLVVLLWITVFVGSAGAQTTGQTSRSDLIKQANAPISTIFQIRFQDSYAPAFQGKLHGQGNTFSIAVTMPLPKYRLLPFPQLSLITVPVATTLPLPTGTSEPFSGPLDLRETPVNAPIWLLLLENGDNRDSMAEDPVCRKPVSVTLSIA
jgi:hypothetical protein